MAGRTFKLARKPTGSGLVSGLAGWLALAMVLCLIFGTLLAVGLRAEGAGRFGPADWSALRFTLLQASLSALISVGLAVPLARALSRRKFPLKGVLVTLMGAPFILPVLVAVLGLLAVFGRSGVINSTLVWAGIEPVSIYGLHGVVLAHVFFNLPLATRFILQGWQAIPGERFRLAASLGFTASDVGRVLERPMLRTVLPGAMLAVFLVCLTSFAVALTMGGGPRATTIELAIYQAVRLDFDLGKAALLALVQLGLGLTAAMLAFRVALPDAGFGAGYDRAERRWEAEPTGLRLLDTFLISAGALFLLLPLGMVVLNGLPGLVSLPEAVWWAALRSLGVALIATSLTLTLGFAIAALTVLHGVRMAASMAMLGIVASPLVIGTGLFIIIHPLANPAAFALPVTALVNALMALPFVLRALLPALSDVEVNYGRLADGLGMQGWARMKNLYWPRMRRPLGFAAGLTAALSMGDLGVVTLFAAPDQATLPLQLYRLMGAYRMQDAAATGLLLLALSLTLFWLFDQGGRGRA